MAAKGAQEMSITHQVRRRLAVALTGLTLASALIVGIAPVAADNDTPEPRDINVGMEATGMASDTHVTITEIVAPPAVSNDTTAAPVAPLAVDPDDHRG
jgi:hypothetical protein